MTTDLTDETDIHGSVRAHPYSPSNPWLALLLRSGTNAMHPRLYLSSTAAALPTPSTALSVSTGLNTASFRAHPRPYSLHSLPTNAPSSSFPVGHRPTPATTQPTWTPCRPPRPPAFRWRFPCILLILICRKTSPILAELVQVFPYPC